MEGWGEKEGAKNEDLSGNGVHAVKRATVSQSV